MRLFFFSLNKRRLRPVVISILVAVLPFVHVLHEVHCVMQISYLAKSLRVLADMNEPIGHVLTRMEVRNVPHGYVILAMKKTIICTKTYCWYLTSACYMGYIICFEVQFSNFRR